MMFTISMNSTGSTPKAGEGIWEGGTWAGGTWVGKGVVYLEEVVEEGIRGVPPGIVDVVEGGAAGIILIGIWEGWPDEGAGDLPVGIRTWTGAKTSCV